MVNKAADAVNKMTIKMNESDAVSAGEEQKKVRMEELKRGRMKKEKFSKCGTCQKTLCPSHFSTFRFKIWIFYGSYLKVSGRKKRNWNEDVDKTDRKC